MSDVRNEIVTAVNKHLRRGVKFSAAVVLARQEFVSSSDMTKLAAFAEAFFDDVVHGFWGGKASDDQEETGAPVLPGSHRGSREPRGSLEAARATRVYDVTILSRESAVYRCLVDVGGQWRALGTLTREECFTAAASYRRRAAVNTNVADFLTEVGQLVKGTDVVESAIGSDDLAELGRRYAKDGPNGLLSAV